MNLFARHKNLNFSDENIAALTKSVTELKNVLKEIGTSHGQQELTNVLAVAMQKDAKRFKKNVLTNVLFGGSGALWELHAGDEKLQNEFKSKLNNFCKAVLKIGLDHSVIRQAMI